MKKLLVLLVAATLGLTTAVSAKKLPAVAEKLPTDFKQAIAKQIAYPQFAKDQMIKGEVWMKVTLDENSMVRIVDLSATNQELGDHVRKSLTDVTVKSTNFKTGNIYYLKVKFDILTDL